MWSLWSKLIFGLSDKIKLIWWEMQWEHVGSKWENMWGASTVCGSVTKSVGSLITLKQLKMYFSLWSLKVNTLEKGLGLTSTSVWYSWRSRCLLNLLVRQSSQWSSKRSLKSMVWPEMELVHLLFTQWVLLSRCCVCQESAFRNSQWLWAPDMGEIAIPVEMEPGKGWRLQAWQSSCLVWGEQPGKTKQWHLNYVLKSENLLPDGQDQENIVGKGANMAKAVCLETDVVI